LITKGIKLEKPKNLHYHDGVPCGHDHSHDNEQAAEPAKEKKEPTKFQVIKHNEGTGEVCPKGA
jgi:hypothetical protein